MRFYVGENSERKDTNSPSIIRSFSQARNRETAAKQFRYKTILCNGTMAAPRLANVGQHNAALVARKILTREIHHNLCGWIFSFSLSRSEKWNNKYKRNITNRSKMDGALSIKGIGLIPSPSCCLRVTPEF